MSKLKRTLDAVGHWSLQRFIEFIGLTIILLTLALLVATLSYSPFDPSLNVVSRTPVSNLLGLGGAYVSDLILQVLGWGFLAVLPASCALGWRIIRHKATSLASWRLMAALFAAPALAVAIALWPDALATDGAQDGGMIGQLLAENILLLIALAPIDLSSADYEKTFALTFGVLAIILSLFAAALLRQTIAHIARLPAHLTHGAPIAYGWLRARLQGRFLLRRGTAKAQPEIDMAEDADLENDNDAATHVQEDATQTTTPDMAVFGEQISVEEKVGALKAGARVSKEAQPTFGFGGNKGFKLPPLSLLTPHKSKTTAQVDKAALEANARILENVLSEFGVRGAVIKVRPGPVVTLYEFEPAAGVRSSRVVGLADDIARSMSAIACRVAPVPGANAIGIELPNQNREIVSLRELLASSDFEKSKSRLTLALGKDIGGAPALSDLTKMPHLLVAGTTGSGKSVGINTMILSILYRMSPDECRLIMIDPKMLELSVYDGIPHLLAPVVTEPKKAVVALKWVVQEMENRYRKMSKIGVRNIEGYNERMREAIANKEMLSRRVQTGFDHETGEAIFEMQEIAPETLPFIVVIIDEMADLMMVAGKEIEGAVQRLAQMARAAGVHLITATQRPSVDVITGTIKANFPSRISFQVTSRIDSRTVLGEQGGEQLLGQGDMLFMGGAGRLQRVHGPFVSDEEVEKVVSFLKNQGVPEYIESVTEAPEEEEANSSKGGDANESLYDQAVAIVTRDGRASTSYVQRRLQIGYNRAAGLIEQMEEQGVISAPNHAGKREILAGKH